MRKIETEMNNAAFGGYNWKNSNTEVVVINGVSQVYLHGNHIANVYGDDVEVNVDTLNRWPTMTTRSRLRALGADLVSKRGTLYLNGVAL